MTRAAKSSGWKLPALALTIRDAGQHGGDGEAEPRALRHLLHCIRWHGGSNSERGRDTSAAPPLETRCHHFLPLDASLIAARTCARMAMPLPYLPSLTVAGEEGARLKGEHQPEGRHRAQVPLRARSSARAVSGGFLIGDWLCQTNDRQCVQWWCRAWLSPRTGVVLCNTS